MSYLGAYLDAANETIWLDMACKVINGYVSDDTGLYFTLWLISRGEDVLLGALKDPDGLADLPGIPFGEAAFEMLMSVGHALMGDGPYEALLADADAHTAARLAEILPDIVYHGGEKFGNYEDFEAAMADIPNVLPRLIARAEREGFDWRNYI